MGGPAGGNGGRGGHVILIADVSVNTLLPFQSRKLIGANNGARGGASNRTGKSGKDVEVKVPVGTEVWDVTPEQPYSLIGDLVEQGQTLMVVNGGRGGSGNARFVGSTNQEPLLAEAGEYGEHKNLKLELKLLADVGLIGMPNGGKSSILAAISAARPKIANYPFTTLSPVLGVVYHRLDAFIVVDIPGLIEGAHEGIGLGDEFLKHIERTRVLAHVVDGSEPDVAGRLETINRELAEFNPALADVPQITVVNKLDLDEVKVSRSEIEEQVRRVAGDERQVLFISAATHEGIDQLVQEMWWQLQQAPRSALDARPEAAEAAAEAEETPVLRPQPRRRAPEVERVSEDAFRVLHPRAIRLARGSNLDDWQTLVQYQAKLSDFGVSKALTRAGIQTGDTVHIEDWEFEWD